MFVPRFFVDISNRKLDYTDLKKVHSGLTESSSAQAQPTWLRSQAPGPVFPGWWPLGAPGQAQGPELRPATPDTGDTREREQSSQWQSRLHSLVTRKQWPEKWCSTCRSLPQGFQVSMRYRWIFVAPNEEKWCSKLDKHPLWSAVI